MNRVQFVELEDLPWFPAFARAAMTGALRRGVELAGAAERIARDLAPRVRALGVREVVDLCSGSGGPTVALVQELARQGLDVRVTLTDLFPNLDAFRHIAERGGDRVAFRAEPVDATAVPADLSGLRVLMNAFHHLPPEVARGVLADAMAQNQPIAVYEVVGREPLHLLNMLAIPVTLPLIVPLVRPFDWRWVPLVYGLPVLQLTSLWDGLVSVMRIYDEDDLRELTAPLQRPGWRWEIGRIRHGALPAHITVLHGSPTG